MLHKFYSFSKQNQIDFKEYFFETTLREGNSRWGHFFIIPIEVIKRGNAGGIR